MSNTHEPGPWILGGASGRMITTPSGYYGDGFIADVDTKANAKLISAAPDLLKALQSFVDFDEITQAISMSGGTPHLMKALEAIKKATI